jgi:hypothetical protein
MQNKESQEWQEIIENNKNWFSEKTMQFWNSEIYWETLTPHGNGWKFISSEHVADRSHSRYTIRLATPDGITELSEFLEFGTLGEAIKAF